MDNQNTDNQSPPVDESQEPVLCPIAAIKSCRKCPFFSVCPAKEVIGNYRPSEAEREAAAQEPGNDPLGHFSDVLKKTINDVGQTAKENLKEAADATERSLSDLLKQTRKEKEDKE